MNSIMMVGKTHAGLLLLLLAAIPIKAQQKETESTEIAIRSLEQEWTVGQSRNDNSALNLIFDNALIYVEYGKLVSKGEYLSRIKKEAPHIVLEPMTVRVFGNTAIVVGSYRERQFHAGQRKLFHWRFVDTWVLKKNGWVLISAASTPIASNP